MFTDFAKKAGPDYHLRGSGSPVTYGQYVLQRCGGFGRTKLIFSRSTNAERWEPIIQGFNDSIVNWGDAFFQEAYIVLHDPRLSEAGKIEKLTPLQKKYADQYLRDVVSRARNLQDVFFKRLGEAHALPAEISGGDPAVNALQAIELRSYLLTLPMIDRIQTCLKSVDSRLLHALDTAPECMRILPDGLSEKVRAIRVQRRNGKELLDLEDELQALNRIVQTVCNVTSGAEFVPRPELPKMPDSVYENGQAPSDIEAEITTAVEAYLSAAA